MILVGICPGLATSHQEHTLIVKLDLRHSYTILCEASMFFLWYILFAIPLLSRRLILTFWFFYRIK